MIIRTLLFLLPILFFLSAYYRERRNSFLYPIGFVIFAYSATFPFYAKLSGGTRGGIVTVMAAYLIFCIYALYRDWEDAASSYRESRKRKRRNLKKTVNAEEKEDAPNLSESPDPITEGEPDSSEESENLLTVEESQEENKGMEEMEDHESEKATEQPENPISSEIYSVKTASSEEIKNLLDR